MLSHTSVTTNGTLGGVFSAVRLGKQHNKTMVGGFKACFSVLGISPAVHLEPLTGVCCDQLTIKSSPITSGGTSGGGPCELVWQGTSTKKLH